jgi:hypothetical protein
MRMWLSGDGASFTRKLSPQVRVLSSVPFYSGCIVNWIRRPVLETGGWWFESTHPDHFMNNEERQRAEQIIHDFPTWNRPMSTEESDLVDKYREIQLCELLDDSTRWIFGQIVDKEL